MVSYSQINRAISASSDPRGRGPGSAAYGGQRKVSEKIKAVPVLSDPAARKTAEGLLSLFGIPVTDAQTAREGDGSLCWIFDAQAAEAMDGVPAPGETVLILRRPEDPGSPSDSLPGRKRLDLPLLLSEAAEAILSAVRSPGEGSAGPQSGPVTPEKSPDAAREDGTGAASAPRKERTEEAAVPRGPSRSPESRETPEPSVLPVLDESARTVEYRGQSVRLTPKEFALFRILYEKRGEAVPRGELAAVFPESAPGSNPADVYAGYLRRRLRPLFGDGAVLSVRGKGYLFRLPGEEVRFTERQESEWLMGSGQ